MTSSAVADRFDPSADERLDPRLLDELRRDPRSRVLAVRGDRTRVNRTPERTALTLTEVGDLADDAELAFLGRDRQGRAVLLAATSDMDPQDATDGWASLRDVGALLDDDDTAMFIPAVALGRWLVHARFCPACGGSTTLAMAGWARRCDECGREHFPRTDPAVIVALISDDGERLLLGANAAWGGTMFSCFAGFVEAGESAERAVHRELAEETGVRVHDLRYIESQAWPYPRSLMLGFHARVVDEAEVRPDGEEILESRWFTREEVGRGLRGELEVRLPGGASVAHRLIRSWYEAGADSTS